MNELVPLAGLLEPMRNSLILTGLVLRTGSAIEADWSPQVAVPTRSPLNGAGPEVTLIVRLTAAPGATGSLTVTGPVVVQPAGVVTPSVTPVTGAPVVF